MYIMLRMFYQIIEKGLPDNYKSRVCRRVLATNRAGFVTTRCNLLQLVVLVTNR